MKKFFLVLAPLALMVSGCATGPLAGPAQYANKTVLDEQVAIGAELTYKTARVLVETAVDLGQIKGQTAIRLAALDNQAYAATTAVRTAYIAGNATNYLSAAIDARSAITQLVAVVQGAKK